MTGRYAAVPISGRSVRIGTYLCRAFSGRVVISLPTITDSRVLDVRAAKMAAVCWLEGALTRRHKIGREIAT
jgi:hypothetical protein